MKITVKRSAVAQVANSDDYTGEFGGFLAWIDHVIGFQDGVTLTDRRSQMHGRQKLYFNTPDGEVMCSAYYSQPPVPTRKTSVYGDDFEALFGKSRDTAQDLYDAADRGFDHV